MCKWCTGQEWTFSWLVLVAFLYRDVLLACVNLNFHVLNVKLNSWPSYCEMCKDVIIRFFFWLWGLSWTMASSFTRFLDHKQRRTAVYRTPLEEWSARRRDLYLTTHNTHNRQISLPPAGFEPTISVGKRPQTDALDCTVTGIGL